MAKVSEVYAGNYITAAELPDGRRVPAVIMAAEVQVIGQDQPSKLVLSLNARNGRPWPRGLVLNKTNGMVLAAAYGDDTAAWLGRSIEVWKEPVQFQGKIVQGVRTAPARTMPTTTGHANADVPIGAHSGGNGATQPVRTAGVSAVPNPPVRQATDGSAWNGSDVDDDSVPF
jgi:hypothetical protein